MMMNDDEGWRRMIDFKVFWGFAFRRTNERTNGQTFVIVESLSRLKKIGELWINQPKSKFKGYLWF